MKKKCFIQRLCCLILECMKRFAKGETKNQKIKGVFSEENPLTIKALPKKESETLINLIGENELTLLEIEQKYQAISYIDVKKNQLVTGYVLESELNQWLPKNQKNIRVFPKEALELFENKKINETIYLTAETPVVVLETEGHFTKIAYQKSTDEQFIEAFVLTDALKAALSEEDSSDLKYIQLPENKTLSIWKDCRFESELVVRLTTSKLVSVGETVQYVLVSYKDLETETTIEGYVSGSTLIEFVEDELKNQLIESKQVIPQTELPRGIIPQPLVIDISQWQAPSLINYDQISSQVELVIIRLQDGEKVDTAYQTHIKEFQKRGIPVHVYAFFRGINPADARNEARLFYQKAKDYEISMYWIDVEVETASNMRESVSAYTQELRSLVASDVKIGAYIANQLYTAFNLNTAEFDAIWIPTYGINDGTYNGSNPWHVSDIHQYTDRGRLNGYSSDLDFNRLTGINGKDINYFIKRVNTGGDVSKFYYTTNPGILRLKSKLNVYSSVEFTTATKTGKVLPKDSVVNVIGIEYSTAGTPRLKVSDGYISANLDFTVKDKGYYLKNPGAVVVSNKLNVYHSVEFNTQTKTKKSYGKNATVDVLGIDYSKAGTPRLKVTDGYVSANELYSNPYYLTNPGTIYLTSKLNVYRSVTFDESTKIGKSFAKGSTIKVTGIAYSANGTPRLRVEDGFISANAEFSQIYISINPGTIKLASKLNVYNQVDFTEATKTAQSYSKGSTIKVIGISYSTNGTPRLQVEGGYISAKAEFFQK